MSAALQPLTNGNAKYRTEIIIILRKGRRTEPIMEINKENVSPIKPSVVAGEKDSVMDGLTDSFQKRLEINGIDKDGRYFLDVVKKETDRLLNLCESSEKAMNEDSPSEEGNLYNYYVLQQHKCLETANDNFIVSDVKIQLLHKSFPILFMYLPKHLIHIT